MWDGLFTLLSYGFFMALASFLAGSLPLSFGLSQNHSRIISAIGTGLLVGTCLIIIIPEGVETLYSASAYSMPSQPPTSGSSGDLHDHVEVDPTRRSLVTHVTNAFHLTRRAVEHSDPHAWIGMSLILGFIMMYLIDQLPRHAAKLAMPKKPLHISLANLSQGPHRVPSPRASQEGDAMEDYHEQPISAKGSATTIGLVIHAAADGVALAASSFVSKISTGLIVFLALMLHKAPAAFGLTSVLLKQGRTKRQARAHLIVFSLAAPFAALATWVVVNLVAGEHIEGQENTAFATGLLLLFSGGTFLFVASIFTSAGIELISYRYVAMHTMQESAVDTAEEGGNGFANGHPYTSIRSGRGREKPFELRDTMLVVVGMLLPLLAQIGHA